MARSPSPPEKLGDFLCFAVYSANLAFGRAYRPILDKLGLTYTQYAVSYTHLTLPTILLV